MASSALTNTSANTMHPIAIALRTYLGEECDVPFDSASAE
jgi:hypothetical protein